MIKINEKQFENYEIKIAWKSFERVYLGESIKSIAPFIQFTINNIFIGLETCLSKDILANIKLNEKTNINQYLTDITFEDEKGWISIITGKYNCNITKISNTDFQIDFFINSEEIEINICINVNVELL